MNEITQAITMSQPDAFIENVTQDYATIAFQKIETKITRGYSISSEEDQKHTENGRCPDYALSWGPSTNAVHWKSGHDYFIGNGLEISDETKELRQILSRRLSNGTLTKYILFCDLDGVLADFEKGVYNKFKKYPDQLNPGLMWGVINKSSDFFETLPFMPKGGELWDNIRHYNPIILTGLPKKSDAIKQQKINWCKRELGDDVDVITCLTKDKCKYCLRDAILIDDRTSNLNKWTERGGKFILYSEDKLETIIQKVNRHMTTDMPSP
jgi:hypothetical protein